MASSSASSHWNGSEPVTKKPRTDSDPPPPSMDEGLAFLNDIEQDAVLDFSSSQSTCSPDLMPAGSSQPARGSWRRPPPPKINPSSDPLVFQQIDIDHCIGGVVPGMPGAQGAPVPILRMFGVTMEGNSVCAHIHGFLPYFFVPAPLGFRDEHCTKFRKELNNVIMGDLRSNHDNVQEAVLAVEICQKSSIYGFYFNEKTNFLKITLTLPKLIAPARRLISSINVPPFGQIQYQVHVHVYSIHVQIDRKG